MKPRILIPLPTSNDHTYNTASIGAYAEAVRNAGGDPIELPLSLPPNELLAIARTAQGILLPGSGADVQPARYGQPRDPDCADPDLPRESTDTLLIEHAERTRTPLLCICFGLQSLNVHRGGTLIQHLAPMPVNHRAGKAVSVAHAIDIAPQSHLGRLVTSAHSSSVTVSIPPSPATIAGSPTNPRAPSLAAEVGTATNPRASSPAAEVGTATEPGAPYLAAVSSPSDVGRSATETSAPTEDRDNLTIRNGLLHLNVNSSHHQAIGIPGEGLRIVARSTEDGVIEAIENDPGYKATPDTEPNHWLLAVQWHPERTTEISPLSQAIFKDFIAAAKDDRR